VSSFSIGGDEQDWIIFSRVVKSGKPVLFRSRTANPDLRAFADGNVMTRLRCELPPDQLNEAAMPTSTEELDAFEDKLIDGLTGRDAQTYLLAVVTGEGNRDFFFAGVDRTEIREVVKAIPANPSFKLKLADVEAKDAFLDQLTVPAEALERAKEQASGGGGFLSRMFGGSR
jgi:hypothetical protein